MLMKNSLGAIDAEFVRTNLYENILGRDPLATNDAAGMQYWTDQANQNNWTQDQLKSAFLTSAKTVLQNSTAQDRAYLAPAVFSAPAPSVQTVKPSTVPVAPAVTTQATPSTADKVLQAVTQQLGPLSQQAHPAGTFQDGLQPGQTTLADTGGVLGGNAKWILLGLGALLVLRR